MCEVLFEILFILDFLQKYVCALQLLEGQETPQGLNFQWYDLAVRASMIFYISITYFNRCFVAYLLDGLVEFDLSESYSLYI